MFGRILLTFVSIAALFAKVKPNDDWDYLVFTQTWPGTFCKFNKCSYPADIIDGWTIHGLWPSRSRGRFPSYCRRSPQFDKDQIKGIYSELSVQWPNLFDYSQPLNFWKHEWTKHGSCSLSDAVFTDELSYFRIGLNLKYKIALEKVLHDDGIVPKSDVKYETYKIKNAVYKIFRVQPILQCVKLENGWHLSAIELCMDRDLKFIGCPQHHKNYNKNLYQSSNSKTLKAKYNPDTYQFANSPCGKHKIYFSSNTEVM